MTNSSNNEHHVRLSDKIEGQFELTPLHLHHTRGDAEAYPPVLALMPVDAGRLLDEYERCHERLGDRYLVDRKDHLNCGFDEAVGILKDYGFYSSYLARSLLQTGKTEFFPEVPEHTRALFNDRLSPFCRVHYATAQPGWRTVFHRDCDHFRQHGFRINIPLSESAYLRFRIGGRVEEYELVPGHAWFVNNALEHLAYNPCPKPRVSILAQLMTDALF